MFIQRPCGTPRIWCWSCRIVPPQSGLLDDPPSRNALAKCSPREMVTRGAVLVASARLRRPVRRAQTAENKQLAKRLAALRGNGDALRPLPHLHRVRRHRQPSGSGALLSGGARQPGGDGRSPPRASGGEWDGAQRSAYASSPPGDRPSFSLVYSLPEAAEVAGEITSPPAPASPTRSAPKKRPRPRERTGP